MKPTHFAIVAVASGLLAAIGTELYLGTRQRTLERAYEPVEILVAASTIAAGDEIQPDRVQIARLSQCLVQPDALQPADRVLLDGARARREIPAGSPLRPNDLADHGPADLVHRIAAGRRAMTVPVSRVTSVSNLVRPGDRVDLLVADQPRDWEPQAAAADARASVEVVLEDVEILAVDRAMDPTALQQEYDTVTIHVTPADASKVLAAMSRHGSWSGLTLLLRSRDSEAVATR
ncbi:MAG: Flp pilus assembly protein CpaB [Planctomycetota bacterium]